MGRGVERDEKKAQHYYELAAMEGDACSRHKLARAGNHRRALRRYMISAGGGSQDALKKIQRMVIVRGATSDDFAKALSLYPFGDCYKYY